MIGIGINSGTSADGVDIAVVEFGGSSTGSHSIRLLWSGSSPYPPSVKQLFLELVDHAPLLTSAAWFDIAGRFDTQLGAAYAGALFKALRASGIKKSRVAFIGSHGQTVWHAPGPSVRSGTRQFGHGSTIQLGSPSVLAERTGIPVVAGFRNKDVALGGQGAPLAPILHFELFRRYAPAVVLNIGGIANVTVIPSQGSFSGVCGFDTGPGNRLIDIAVAAYTQGRQGFDRNGILARRGTTDAVLLEKLMRDRFVMRRPPKSTGREYYNEAYLRAHGVPLDEIDSIATLTDFTAHAVAGNLRRFVKRRIRRLIVCGGGARNKAILGQLSGLMDGVEVMPVETFGYPASAIEPMLFAYLGYLGFNRLPVRLRNITGSSHPFVPGGIYVP